MEKTYVIFVICTAYLFTECKSASVRSGRYKRTLMQHFLHIYWDPGRLISYFDAVETTKEIVNDWRKKLPAILLMPILGDKRVKDHFLGPVVGYKKHAPMRRKSYLYPHGTFHMKPFVADNPDEDTIPLNTKRDSETSRVVVLPKVQFNKDLLPLTPVSNIGFDAPAAQHMRSHNVQVRPFNENSSNGKKHSHILRTFSHSRIPIYEIPNRNDYADISVKGFPVMTTAASEYSPGRKILPVPKDIDLSAKKNNYHIAEKATVHIPDDDYISEYLPCLENYNTSEVPRKPSHLVKMSSIIKILKQKSPNVPAERERNNEAEVVSFSRNRPKTDIINSAQTRKQTSKASDQRAEEDTTLRTRTYPNPVTSSPSGNSAYSHLEVINDAKEDHDIPKKLPDFQSEASQHVKQSVPNKIMLVVIKKQAP